MDGASFFDNNQGPYFDGCNTYALGSASRCRSGYRNENGDGVCVKQSASAIATRKSNSSRSRKTGKTPPKKPSPTRKRSQKMYSKKTSTRKCSQKMSPPAEKTKEEQWKEARLKTAHKKADEIRAERWDRGIMTPSPSDLSDDSDGSPKSTHPPTRVTLMDGTTLELPSKIKTIGKLKKKIERLLGTPILKQSIYTETSETPLANITKVDQLGPLMMVQTVEIPPEFMFLDKTETKYSEERNNITNMSRFLMRTLKNSTHTPLTFLQLYELIKDDWMQYPIFSRRPKHAIQSALFGFMYQMITDLKVQGYVVQSPSSFDILSGPFLLRTILTHQITGSILSSHSAHDRVAEALAITLVLNREHPYIATLFDAECIIYDKF